MAVDTTWTDPSTGLTIDLDTDQILTAPIWDKVLSNLKHLGGTKGLIGARAYLSGTQAVAHNTQVFIAMGNERFDTDSIHDNVTQNSRLTIQTAGVYIITATMTFAANTSGHRQIGINLNAGYIASHNQPPPSTGDCTISVATIYRLAVSDYLEMSMIQTSGVSLNATAPCEFSAVRLGV